MSWRTWQKVVLGLVVAGSLMLLAMFGQSTPPAAVQPDLAKSVLAIAGIPAQYDRYLMNGVEMVTAPPSNPKFLAWLQQLLVREAGWQQVESQYVATLNQTFSPAELQALATLLQQPVFQKLLQADAQAYATVAPNRRKLFFQVWDAYNQGKYGTVPVEATK